VHGFTDLFLARTSGLGCLCMNRPGFTGAIQASRSAVSRLIALFPFRIDVIRPDGTRNANASLLADSPRVSNSRLRIRLGCTGIINFHPSPSVKIRAEATPYDPTFRDYFERRQRSRRDNPFVWTGVIAEA
jgi:hypothetical protein